MVRTGFPRVPLLSAAAAWAALAAPVQALPGETLDIALRWLGRHPFLGAPRLAPVEGLGVELLFDAWQAGRVLPGGSEVRIFLDVPEPDPHPPLKREAPSNRVRREILLLSEAAPTFDPPPISGLIERIYGVIAAEEYRTADPIPLGPGDFSNGPALASPGVGPLRFEAGAARKGTHLDYREARYRGEADPFAPATIEIRRTIVIVSESAGP